MTMMKGENQAETKQFEGIAKSERRVRFADSLGMELVTIILFERELMMLDELGLGFRYKTRFRYGPFEEMY